MSDAFQAVLGDGRGGGQRAQAPDHFPEGARHALSLAECARQSWWPDGHPVEDVREWVRYLAIGRDGDGRLVWLGRGHGQLSMLVSTFKEHPLIFPVAVVDLQSPTPEEAAFPAGDGHSRRLHLHCEQRFPISQIGEPEIR